jgi:hypothetical protein
LMGFETQSPGMSYNNIYLEKKICNWYLLLEMKYYFLKFNAPLPFRSKQIIVYTSVLPSSNFEFDVSLCVEYWTLCLPRQFYSVDSSKCNS